MSLLAFYGQMYVAYKNEKVDHALSVGFLLCWVCGDITNFIGCYLTNQLLIQTVTANFYVTLDNMMISQFVYYKLKNRKGRSKQYFIRFQRRPNFRESHSVAISLLKWFCVCWVLLFAIAMVTILHLLRISHHNRSHPGQRFQRKSTEGTSYLLFALAMLGNTTYGLSVAVKVPKNKVSAKKYILHHLAWLLGSFGVLLVDFFITAQFIRYRKRSNFSLHSIPEVAPLLDEDEEQLNNFFQLRQFK
ncbi:lysosomal amino acid transporter 1 homolog isoform X4 [Chiloscyllium punctatum]|uniref:lysosomal amino acid transporter 1 homolog isoform X4 n=1 Tax=Chiloscyllium punctatum TaxID=137246 RepID=UPI003B63B3D4